MRAADGLPTFRKERGLRLPLLNLLIALWLLALLNGPFWASLWNASGGWDAASPAWLATLPLFALAWVWLSLEALTWGRAAKPVLCLLLVAAAATAFFMQAYGVVFDRGMLTNVLETDVAEVRELLSAKAAAWILVLGILPAVAVAFAPLRARRWRAVLLDKAATVTVLVVILGSLAVAFFSSYASLFRNHRDLRLKIVPTNLLTATHGYVKARLRHTPTLERVAADATRTPGAERPGRPQVTVIVVGETARAANLSFHGYGRSTTPALAARQGLINLGPAQACGTATATSLPCMFLDVGREGYEEGLAQRRESLLDVLKRAGLDVWWIENNSGCKGVCDRVKVVDASKNAEPDLCGPNGCYDEVLLDALQDRLEEVRRDTVVVLHLKGQHGPAYHLRYPAMFERFTPVCRSNELDRCERAMVVNAYDNALTYTDHVVDWAIALLETQAARLDTAAIFVSDHGESLGEHGLFLHGMPYELAPKEQKEVPFLLWLAPSTSTRLKVDPVCLARQQGTLSHDNLYHSVLTLVGVQADVYRPSADVLKPCAGLSMGNTLMAGAGSTALRRTQALSSWSGQHFP